MSVRTVAYLKACVDLANQVGAERIVEIGVKSGRLSRRLIQVPTMKALFLVDSWEGATRDRRPPYFLPYSQKDMDRCAAKTKAWAATKKGVTVFHMRSANAAPLFEDGSVDFVHIDGDHTFNGVTIDIKAWMPKVRSGGIISGDDYTMDTVKRAVDELIPHRKLMADGRVWWTTKA
jgi:Methyltransferase domain